MTFPPGSRLDLGARGDLHVEAVVLLVLPLLGHAGQVRRLALHLVQLFVCAEQEESCEYTFSEYYGYKQMHHGGKKW